MNKVGNDQEKNPVSASGLHTQLHIHMHITQYEHSFTHVHTHTHTQQEEMLTGIVQGMALFPGPSVDLLSRTPLQVHLEAPLHHLVKMVIWPGSVLVSFHPSSEEPDVDM